MNANQLEKVSSSGKNNRKNECIIKGSPPFEKIDRIIAYVSKSICKVIIKKESFYSQGTGFLLAIWIDNERFFCLVSNEHVIKKEFLNDEYIIKISYDNCAYKDIIWGDTVQIRRVIMNLLSRMKNQKKKKHRIRIYIYISKSEEEFYY